MGAERLREAARGTEHVDAEKTAVREARRERLQSHHCDDVCAFSPLRPRRPSILARASS